MANQLITAEMMTQSVRVGLRNHFGFTQFDEFNGDLVWIAEKDETWYVVYFHGNMIKIETTTLERTIPWHEFVELKMIPAVREWAFREWSKTL